MTQVQTCLRCGGARFFGSGVIGWGGPICNCQNPQIPNPDVPGAMSTQLATSNSYINIELKITEQLARIESKLDWLKEHING